MGNSEERYAYDGGHVWADLDNTNAITVRYLFRPGTDQIESRDVVSGPNSGRSFYLADRLGSVRDIVDWSQNVGDHIEYDGFGVATHTTASVADRYGHTGRERDEKTGLNYHRGRYYDAPTGRWMSEDPIDFEAGDPNLYRYVGNEATNATDPDGLSETPVRTVVPKALGEKGDTIKVTHKDGISKVTKGMLLKDEYRFFIDQLEAEKGKKSTRWDTDGETITWKQADVWVEYYRHKSGVFPGFNWRTMRQMALIQVRANSDKLRRFWGGASPVARGLPAG